MRPSVKYAFIKAHKRSYTITQLCGVLGVSRRGYYAWFRREPSKRSIDNARLLTKIRCYHKSSKERYGSPRIHHDLLSDGEQVGRHRVARLMKEVGDTMRKRIGMLQGLISIVFGFLVALGLTKSILAQFAAK